MKPLHSFFYAFVSILITGCLINQHEPTPQTGPQTLNVSGSIVLEDMGGFKEEANFFAEFGRKNAEKREERGIALRQIIAGMGIHSATLRETAKPCEFAKQAKTNGTNAATVSRVSVGKVAFGPAMQSKMIEADESSDHQYTKKLEPKFAAGPYQVTAQGLEGIGKLQDILSMPEELKWVKGNDQSFETGVVVKRDSPLRLTWAPSSMPNDSNYLISTIQGVTDTEVFQLYCLIKESQLAKVGEWEIPQNQIQQLLLTENAALFLIRAHVRVPSDTHWDVLLQGLRTYLAAAAVR